MLGINTNVNSLVAQQNLNGSQSALSQAITRLSSGNRINSAADDAAGLAIATRMQTQINGLNQGVQNTNDAVSLIQTTSSQLSSLTSSLQRISTLATQAATGTLSSSDQAAAEKEVAQQIQEVNRIAAQTNFNGKNLLDGSAGIVTFQIGANVGQTVSLDLSQSLSAAKIGGGLVQSGTNVGTIQNLSLDANGAATTAAQPAITSVNVLSDGKGGFTFTDQNGQALSTTAVGAIFTTGTAAGTGTAVTNLTLATGATSGMTTAQASAAANMISQINSVNAPPTVSSLNINNATSANQAIVSVANALSTINNLQATLGATQNRLQGIAQTQQANSTNLSSAQSQIQSADFAQETAALSKAQVLQQAGISVLAQANSLPQQVLKLLQ
ncbi:flagellin [Burkholderia glumae]|uniref:flagellin n=1 Tax=Burkholderia glumae TaxID=337 RepID=UPI000C274258|nr:flagellin [Burkholderia glumae]PJO22056.1 flagellin [Burkholderia glumae AU6208]QHE10423.1 flagellin [Burkholderia glumae AU6208]